jgi:hypothetical protein
MRLRELPHWSPNGSAPNPLEQIGREARRSGTEERCRLSCRRGVEAIQFSGLDHCERWFSSEPRYEAVYTGEGMWVEFPLL